MIEQLQSLILIVISLFGIGFIIFREVQVRKLKEKVKEHETEKSLSEAKEKAQSLPIDNLIDELEREFDELDGKSVKSDD